MSRNLTRTTLDSTRPIWQSMALFLLPLMLSNALQSLSATSNSIFLGRLVGVHALAAVSSIFPIIFFLVSFLIGLGSGASVLVGQAFGARDAVKVKAIVGTTLTLSVAIGCVVGLFGGAFAREMLRLVATPADIMNEAVGYAQITFYAMPLLFFYLIYTIVLRGTSDTQTPLYALLFSTVVTLLISPALITGFGGLPRLGTNGAAWSGVLANVLTALALLLYLRARKHPLAFDGAMVRALRPDFGLALKVVRIGLPTALNVVMVSLSEIAVLSFVNRFGSTATAAYGAVNQIVSYVQFPAISIGIAASIFGSQTIGAGRTERMPTIVRAAVTLNYVIEFALIALLYVIGRSVIALFVTDPKTIAVALGLFHITLWSYAIFGNARVLSNIMLSSGAVLWPTIISIGSIWLIEVPVAYVLMQRIGLDGVWYGYPAAFIAALCAQTFYYFVFWKRRPLTKLV